MSIADKSQEMQFIKSKKGMIHIGFFPASFRNGLSFPLLCKFNSNIPEGTNSLHCELELAQSSEVRIKSLLNIIPVVLHQ